VALNFTPVPRNRYRIGLPLACAYKEVFNSDSSFYGGSNLGNGSGIRAEPIPWMGQAYSAEIELPPLAGIILTRYKFAQYSIRFATHYIARRLVLANPHLLLAIRTYCIAQPTRCVLRQTTCV